MGKKWVAPVELNFGDGTGVSLRSVIDLTDSEIRLGDYIKLRGLEIGDIIYLRDDGANTKVIFIGNATPYEGVSNVPQKGWDSSLYNTWIVDKVVRMSLEQNGLWLDPRTVNFVKEESKNL